MPIYKVNGEIYDIPASKQHAFEQKYPEATVSYLNGADEYDIPLAKRDAFLTKYPDAKTFSLSQSNAESNSDFPMFNDEPNAPMTAYSLQQQEQPETIRSLGGAAKQTARVMGADIRTLWGEMTNLISGSSRDDSRALQQLEKMVAEGKDVSKEVEGAWTDLGRDLRTAPLEFLPEWMIKGWKNRVHTKAEEMKVLDDIRDVLAETNGDVDKARTLLAQRAKDTSYGDEQMLKAEEVYADVKPTEGFAAWVGQNMVQMIPSASALIVGALTKSPAAAKIVGTIGMGAMTASTAGSSMHEAREAGASDTETWKVGVVDGLIEYITEKLPFDRYTNRLSGKLKKEAAESMQKALADANGPARKELGNLLTKANELLGGKLFSKKNVQAYIADMLAEGASEFTAEALQTMSSIIYENPGEYPTIEEAVANGWEGFKAGVFMGSILGGASMAISHQQHKARRKEREVVKVGLVEREGVMEVGEIVAYNPETKMFTITDGTEFYEVTGDKIKEHYDYTYNEFENARLTELEDEAIENANVSEGQVAASADRVGNARQQLDKALADAGYTDEQKAMALDALDNGSVPVASADENVLKAMENYLEAKKRDSDIQNAKAQKEQNEKDSLRKEIEQQVGGRFWRESEEGETVEVGTLKDGRVVYILSDVNENGEASAVTEKGEQIIINMGMLNDITLRSSLDEFLDARVQEGKKQAEQARMSAEATPQLNEIRAKAQPGVQVNLGTADSPIVGTILQIKPEGDGVLIQTESGVEAYTYEQLGDIFGTPVRVLTDAQVAAVEAAEIEAAEAARAAELAQTSEEMDQVEATTDTATKMEDVATETPLPTNPDGSVNEDALFAEDPARWAEWNDSQRNDGGENSRAYIQGKIDRAVAKIAELQKAYEAEDSLNKKKALEKAIAEQQKIVESLSAVAQKYAPTDEQILKYSEEVKAKLAVEKLKAITERTAKWEKKLGLKINILKSIDEVKDPSALETIAKGRTRAWFDPNTLEVYVYAPHIALLKGEYIDKDVDEAIFHEVVGHKGIKQMLKPEKFDQLLDRVWNEVMTEADRLKYSHYAGVKGNTRRAADEYMAHISEGMQYDSIWNKIANWFKDLIGFEVNIETATVEQILRESYRNFGKNTGATTTPEGAKQDVMPSVIETLSEDLTMDEIREVTSNDLAIAQQTYDALVANAPVVEQGESSADYIARKRAYNEQLNAAMADLEAKRAIVDEVAMLGTPEGAGNELSEEASVEILEANGMEVNEDTDDILFSHRYSLDEQMREQVLDGIMKVTGRPREDAEKWLESEQSATALVLADKQYLDYVPDDRYKAIKDNSDYPQGTVDFNNICRKRVSFTKMFTRLQRRFPNRVFTADDLADIRTIMSNDGLVVACGLCYVEDRRQMVGEVAAFFIDQMQKDFVDYTYEVSAKDFVAGKMKRKKSQSKDKVKKAAKYKILIGNDTYVPKVYDLTTLEGLDKLYREHRGIWDAFQAFNSDRGQQSQNLFQGYAEYKREILSWSDAKVKKVNSLGGLRVFSYSDFEAHHLLDLIQIIIDCAARGVMIQGYTKVPEFARAVAMTGIKLNRSLIPLGDTGIVDGKLAYDPIEGIDVNDPNFLESNDNVGNILIGINDEQIRLAMADPFIHYIIPYHARQAEGIRMKLKVGKWENYIDTQNERNVRDGKRVKKGINIYTDVLDKSITNDREFVEKYLAVCKKKGYIPKFDQFLNRDAEGNYIYTPGYHKFLVDFKLFDENGNILPQRPVVAQFDDAFNAEVLQNYVAEEKETTGAQMNETYKKIVEALELNEKEAEGEDLMFSTRETVKAMVEDLSSDMSETELETYLQYQRKLAKERVDALEAIHIEKQEDESEEDFIKRMSEHDKDVFYANQDYEDFGIALDILSGVDKEAPKRPISGNIYGREGAALAHAVNQKNNVFALGISGVDSITTANYYYVYENPKNKGYAYSNGEINVIFGVPIEDYSEKEEEITKFIENGTISTREDVIAAFEREAGGEGQDEGNNANAIQEQAGNGANDSIHSAEQSERSSNDGEGTRNIQGTSENSSVGITAPKDNQLSTSNRNQAIFVSNAAKAVEGIKMEKATPEQWLKMIEKSGGLKAGEDKWMGLSDWLKASDKKTLTKDEVMQFVNDNMIVIEEQHYGELGESNREKAMHDNMIATYGQDFYNRFVGDAFLFEDAIYGEGWALSIENEDTAIDLYNEYSGDTITASQYGLDGYEMEKIFAWAERLVKDLEVVDNVKEIDKVRKRHRTDGLSNYHEIALTVPTIEPWEKSKTNTIHFEDAGEGRAVVWTRFGDTTTEDGKKVLVIDEVQSARHEAAREEKENADGNKEKIGYKDKAKIAEIETQIDALLAEQEKIAKDILHKQGYIFHDEEGGKFSEKEEYDALTGRIGSQEQMARQKEIDTELYNLNRSRRKLYNAIPAAPFEKNWQELAMKRMLRYAAENGYDVVAWTKGEQQAERYDLGKVVSSVGYRRTNDGKRVRVNLRGGESLLFDVDILGKITEVHRGDMISKGMSLNEIVGADLAKQIDNYEGEVDERGDYYIKSENFRIGGEGMKGFYDKMLPAFMNKYGKKWGIKVEDINLPHLENGLTMHSVPVTEEMKQSVMEGQLMFSTSAQSEPVSEEYVTLFSTRTKPAPTKTQMVYKLMRLGADGRLYPLYIDSAEGIELKVWYDADSPNMGDIENLEVGYAYKIDENGNVVDKKKYNKTAKGSISALPNKEQVNSATNEKSRWIVVDTYADGSKAFYNVGINGSGTPSLFGMRPGWHAGSLPTMRQIGKGPKKDLRDDSFVWVRGYIPADIDYQAEADANSSKDIQTHIPTDGYYLKATNANKKASQADKMGWYIAGSFYADEIISDAEARRVIDEWNTEHPDANVEYDYPRESGKEYDPARGGLVDSEVLFSTESTNFASAITPEVRKEMDVISAQAIVNGNYLKAPNGKDTKLTPEQWALVRTQNFKNWFGDWINDPENASKVVDENGEPKVVYHQTNAVVYINRETGENWDELDWRARQEWDERDDWEDYWEEQDFNTFSRVNARTTNEFDGFFFAPEYDEYHEYGERTIPAFLNIKHPASNKDYDIDPSKNNAGREERLRLQNEGFDGVIRMEGEDVWEYVAFSPNQIKSATENNGEYSESEDIRFSTRQSYESAKAFIQTETDKFYETYNTTLPAKVVYANSRKMIAEALGYKMEEMPDALYKVIREEAKKGYACVVEIDDKPKAILVFPREDVNQTAKMARILFHENTHPMISDKPELLDLGKWLIENPKGIAEGVAEQVKSQYAEEDWNEEMVCDYIGAMLSLGRSQEALDSVPEEYKPLLNYVYERFGYKPENEDPRRRSERLADARELHMRNSENAESNEGNSGLLFSTGREIDDLLEKGLPLSVEEYTNLAANIFKSMPEDMRKEVVENASRDNWDLKKATFQMVTRLAEKSKLNDEEVEFAKLIAQKVDDAVRDTDVQLPRPLTTNEALWALYQSTNRISDYDVLGAARKAAVADNLGFSPKAKAEREKLVEEIMFSTASDANNNATANLYNKGAVNMWTRLKESFVDMHASVEELVKAIEKASGKVAKGFEDILLALNQQSSKGLAAMEEYERKFLEPMFNQIVKIMKEAKASYDDVVRYVILKHGLERNDKMAKRDAKEFWTNVYGKVANMMKGQSHASLVVALSDAKAKVQEIEAKLATAKGAVKTKLQEQLDNAKLDVTIVELALRNDEKANEQELKDRLDAVEAGTDAKYKELRNQDYSGISSMFYDTLGVDRKQFDTEEAYQAALMRAKAHKYDTLADIEGAAQMEVDLFEKTANTKGLWKSINAATKEILRQQYMANMISKEQYESLRDMFQFYVPLRGFADNTAEDMYTYYRKPNSTGYTKPILGAEGRSTEAESPFGWIASMASSAIASNVKNEAKLALYYFVSNRPDNGVATISKTWYVDSGEVDERGRKIFKPAYPPFTEDLSSDQAKADYEAWQENMRQLRDKGMAYESGQRLNLGDSVVNINEKNRPEHVVNVKIGGKDYTIIINGNPRAAQAINGDLNIEAVAQDYSKVFGPMLRWMSSVNTSYNPEFWVTNTMRDMLFTWMSVNVSNDPEYKKKFGKNYRKAFKVLSLTRKYEKGTLGNSQLENLYKEFVKNGGVTGYTQIKDNEIWEKEIAKYMKSKNAEEQKKGIALKWIKDALHGMHRIGESLEQVSRFAAFLTAKEMGLGTAESINKAKEITVNFNRKGSGQRITLEEAAKLTNDKGQPLNDFQKWFVWGLSSIAPLGRRAIMFFNASIQGLNAYYKLFKNNPKKMATWAAGYAIIGILNAVMHSLLDDDDDYMDMPDYERRTNLMLGGNGIYIKWALPQEARAFYALGDLAVESILGRNPHENILGEALELALDVAPLNPTEGWRAVVPSIALPFIELLANEDYKGDPIYNEMKWLSDEEKKHTPKWENAYQGTGKPFILLSKLMNGVSDWGDTDKAGLFNVHPESIEHLVESAFGGTIRTAEKGFNTVWNMFDPEEEMTVRQTPFLNRILTINNERYTNVHTSEVFDYYLGYLDSVDTRLKKYRKENDVKNYNELMESDEVKWLMIYNNKYKKPLKRIKEEIKTAKNSSEKKEFMRLQDQLRKDFIKEISSR